METIEVRYKQIEGTNFYHKYIIYTDSLGNQFYARGGPVVTDITGNEYAINAVVTELLGTGPLHESPFGSIKTFAGPYVDGTPDWEPNGTRPSEIIKVSDDLSNEWNKVVEAMYDIGNGQYLYRGMTQNSNTTVDEALERAGLPQPQNDGIDKFWSPASGGFGIVATLTDIQNWMT